MYYIILNEFNKNSLKIRSIKYRYYEEESTLLMMNKTYDENIGSFLGGNQDEYFTKTSLCRFAENGRL